MWKVFSREGNQCWFEKQFQEENKQTNHSTPELKAQQQKDVATTGKAGKGTKQCQAPAALF